MQGDATEQEDRVDIACRLYDAGQLALWPAAQMADLGRDAFEAELMRRAIPVYRPGEAEFEADLAALQRLRENR